MQFVFVPVLSRFTPPAQTFRFPKFAKNSIIVSSFGAPYSRISMRRPWLPNRTQIYIFSLGVGNAALRLLSPIITHTFVRPSVRPGASGAESCSRSKEGTFPVRTNSQNDSLIRKRSVAASGTPEGSCSKSDSSN